MDDTKPYPKDLYSPCQELSNGGLGFVVALVVCSGIVFLCVSTGGPIQLQTYCLQYQIGCRTAKFLCMPFMIDIVLALVSKSEGIETKIVHDGCQEFSAGFYIATTEGLRSSSTLAMVFRVGLRWHFCCGCPILKSRPALDFSSKKSGVVFFSPEKLKNELVRPKTMFLVILAKIRSFSNNSDM